MPGCITSCVTIFFVGLWGSAFGGPFVSLVEGHENNVKSGPAEQFSKLDNTTEFHYDNETATLTAIIQSWPPQSGINRYEVMLWAMIVEAKHPPTDCLSDFFLPHSVTKLETCESANPTSRKVNCITKNDASFTLEFHYIYTGYYCFTILPFNGTNTRRSHQKILHFETNLVPEADIPFWNTTIDLQPIPHLKSIFVSFTNALPEFHITAFKVTLLRGNQGKCESGSAWDQQIAVMPEQQSIHVEYTNISEGYYCVVITPIDFRCEGRNLWTVKGSCSRRSDVKYLKDLFSPHESPWMEKESIFPFGKLKWTLELWVILIILIVIVILIVGLIVGLVTSKKNKQPASVFSVKSTLEATERQQVGECKSPEPREVILLYSRESAEINRRVAELRLKLQRDHHMKVYDYGDESQAEEMAIEGVEWIPNRIHRSNARVVVVYSQEALRCQRFLQCSRKDNSQSTIAEEKTLLLGEYESIDCDFVYGMQLLLGSMATRQHAYQRIFNARFNDVSQPEDIFTLMTPFTSFVLPAHFDQLVAHLKS